MILADMARGMAAEVTAVAAAEAAAAGVDTPDTVAVMG